ncbi:MAG: hypothetical protein JWQ94_3411 [Tardiphaga sp.]|jgi:uncharacterized protein (TIGR02444 family)|nr:hypothetical protein [Tardiphaga sp.]
MTNSDSWAFALRIYAEPDVAAACLRLQDDAGVDVLLLLGVAFASGRGIPLSPSDIAAMDEACRPWREQVVQPLRALRIALKAGPPPAPDAATEILRNQIKASELHAERLANDLLASWLKQHARSPRAITTRECRTALCDVVALALPESHSHRIGEFSPAIDTIVAAAQRLAT